MSEATHSLILTDAERLTLEARWYEGHMLPFVDWVIAFSERHRGQLLASTPADDSEALIASIKRLIADIGSVHLAGELQDQRREMQNEVWYRGQRGEHDCSVIQMEWTARHAADWRRWRIKEYLFVVDRCAPLLLEVVRNGSDGIAEIRTEESAIVYAQGPLRALRQAS